MWQLKPGQTFRFRRFDDEFVLYNDLSGDTHLLDDSAMHLLSVLQHSPASHEQLCASLAGALACPRDTGLDAEAAAMLAQLAALSLIQPA